MAVGAPTDEEFLGCPALNRLSNLTKGTFPAGLGRVGGSREEEINELLLFVHDIAPTTANAPLYAAQDEGDRSEQGGCHVSVGHPFGYRAVLIFTKMQKD